MVTFLFFSFSVHVCVCFWGVGREGVCSLLEYVIAEMAWSTSTRRIQIVGVQRGAPKGIHRPSLIQKFEQIFQSGGSFQEISIIF